MLVILESLFVCFCYVCTNTDHHQFSVPVVTRSFLKYRLVRVTALPVARSLYFKNERVTVTTLSVLESLLELDSERASKAFGASAPGDTGTLAGTLESSSATT